VIGLAAQRFVRRQQPSAAQESMDDWSYGRLSLKTLQLLACSLGLWGYGVLHWDVSSF